MRGAVPDAPAPAGDRRCARQFDQIRQRTRGLLTALPTNRALLGAPAATSGEGHSGMTSHVTLSSKEHRDIRIRGGASAELGDAVMACITVPSEFRRVQNEFPILFRRDLESGRFSALVLFGFENGENLFLRGWALGRELPPAGAFDPTVPDRTGARTRRVRGSHRPAAQTGRRRRRGGLACVRRRWPPDALSRERDGRARRTRPGLSRRAPTSSPRWSATNCSSRSRSTSSFATDRATAWSAII